MEHDSDSESGDLDAAFVTARPPSASHLTTPSNRIVFNVSGVRFETYRTTLRNIPDTRLAWLADAEPRSTSEFDWETGEFFYDRHPGCFLMILNYYRTGKLHTPIDVCGPMFEAELTFWGINEDHIEPCCWKVYHTHRDAEATVRQLGNSIYIDDDLPIADNDDVAAAFGIIEESTRESLWDHWQPVVWKILDYHDDRNVELYDPVAQRATKLRKHLIRRWKAIYQYSTMLAIIVSITGFCMATLETVGRVPISANTTAAEIRTWNPNKVLQQTDICDSLMGLELACLLFFTVEFLARVVFVPRMTILYRQLLSWIDLFALISTFLHVVAFYFIHDHFFSEITFGLQLIITFRIFRLTTHMSGLRILVLTLKSSAKELVLLAMFLLIFVLIFSTIIYFAELVENRNDNHFRSIPVGFWWAVVTMTTLGYGDIYPNTALGYVVGAVCAVIGLLAVALPVPVIVQNFANYYTHAQAVAKMPKRRMNYLLGAPDALKNISGSAQSGSLKSNRDLLVQRNGIAHEATPQPASEPEGRRSLPDAHVTIFNNSPGRPVRRSEPSHEYPNLQLSSGPTPHFANKVLPERNGKRLASYRKRSSLMVRSTRSESSRSTSAGD